MPNRLVEGAGAGAAPNKLVEGAGAGAAPNKLVEGAGAGAAPKRLVEGAGAGVAPNRLVEGAGAAAGFEVKEKAMIATPEPAAPSPAWLPLRSLLTDPPPSNFPAVVPPEFFWFFFISVREILGLQNGRGFAGRASLSVPCIVCVCVCVGYTKTFVWGSTSVCAAGCTASGTFEQKEKH